MIPENFKDNLKNICGLKIIIKIVGGVDFIPKTRGCQIVWLVSAWQTAGGGRLEGGTQDGSFGLKG